MTDGNEHGDRASVVGRKVGYARVSTTAQSTARQEAALRAAGAQRVFVDRGESSRRRDRPEFVKCRDYLREADMLLVYRRDRLAGSERRLIELINDLGERGVDLQPLTEPEIDTTTPLGQALFGIVAVLAQSLVDAVRQNILDGLARARYQGRVGGRPTVMTPARVKTAVQGRAARQSATSIAALLGVSRSSVTRALARVDEVDKAALVLSDSRMSVDDDTNVSGVGGRSCSLPSPPGAAPGHGHGRLPGAPASSLTSADDRLGRMAPRTWTGTVRW